jgi:hypothetical protein
MVFTPSSTAPFVSKRIIPIPNEVSDARVPIATSGYICPYTYWSNTAYSNYTLDVGKIVNFNLR